MIARKKRPSRASGRRSPPGETPFGAAQDRCAVCSQPLDGANQSNCFACGRPFHLAWSTTATVPQCGRVLAHEEAMGLLFMCQSCYEAHNQR